MKLLTLAFVFVAELTLLGGATAADAGIDRRPRLLKESPPAAWAFRFIRQIYVSGSGSDGAAGTQAAPLRTIRAALAKARSYGSGTEIVVRDGIYRESALLVDFDGTPARWNALRGFPGERPTIAGVTGWQLLHLRGSYFLLEGFELSGSKVGFATSDGTPIRSRADLIAWGMRQKGCLSSGENCGSGVYVEARGDKAVHHVVIHDNVVRDFPGAGIATNAADYLLIDGNIVHHNAFISFYGHSGISVWHSRSAGAGSTDEVRILVRNNMSFSNHQYVPSTAIGSDRPTDGNGIIFDQNTAFSYPFRMRAENNIVFDNGGSGIHVYDSDHVDIINNTSCYNSMGNGQNDGEIFANTSSDVRIFNNILVARSGKRLNSNWSNKNLEMGRNILFGTVSPEVAGLGDQMVDPQLAGPCSQPSAQRFVPLGSSPAIDGAASALASSRDHLDRVSVRGRDIGALERP